MRPILEFFLQTRRILLFREIDEKLAVRIVSYLKYFGSISNTPIALYINSPGGDVNCTKSIIDEMVAIQNCGTEIWTVAQGEACSAAAYILAMGTRGRRYASPNSTIMLHPISFDLAPDYQSFQEQVTKYLANDAENMTKMIATACGRGTPKKIDSFKKDIDKSLWMDTNQAIKYGVIDHVWTYQMEGEMNEFVSEEEANT